MKCENSERYSLKEVNAELKKIILGEKLNYGIIYCSLCDGYHKTKKMVTANNLG